MNGVFDMPGGGGGPADPDARERLLAGVPVTDRVVLLAGVPTAVLDGGSGAPLVLLHSSGEFAALWLRVIADLVPTHRVIAPDLPGHGASQAAADALDADQMAAGGLGADRMLAWLGELIERTCPAPPVLVGHGLGGALAARFATHHGDRLAGLCLVDSLGLAPFEPAPSFGLALHRFLEEPTEHTRDGLFQQCFVDLDRLRDQLGERWEALATYALDRARTPEQRAALGTLMPQFGMPMIPPAELARIAVPTAMIWGRHDLHVPLPVAEAASARYGWPLHVIDDAGDDPALEQPAAFLAALRTELATTTPQGAVR